MANTKNAQIDGFLRYYLALDRAPQYAVMVRGQSGSGKTFFMERQLERYRETGGKALYVSLYGMASVKEIEEEFFRQLHPVLASKGMAVAGRVVKGLVKATLKIDFSDHSPVSGSTSIGVPDISLSEYLKNTAGMLLVFDDLERCVIPINELLGYINYFVEHDGYKVVLIANEKEVLDRNGESKHPSTDYARIREKLIGKTFEVEADLEAAIQSFIPEIESNPAREQIPRNLDNVRALYETSPAQFNPLQPLTVRRLVSARAYADRARLDTLRTGIANHAQHQFLLNGGKSVSPVLCLRISACENSREKTPLHERSAS